MQRLIVIFGAAVRPDGSPSGTLERRVRGAWQFGRSRHDTIYLVSGGVGSSGYAEYEVMRSLLHQLGIPVDLIWTETAGNDTLRQIRNCARIILAQPAGAFNVWIATSRYHQLRCWALFNLFGVQAHVAPAIPDRFHLPLRKLIWFWFREVLAVPFDLIIAYLIR